MPVDYSKWDTLELSDDSDIEVHPNIDKRSWIRWKQSDIHVKRQEREAKIAALKQEVITNQGLGKRVDELVQSAQTFPQGAKAYVQQEFERLCALVDRDGGQRPDGQGPTEDDMILHLIMTVRSEMQGSDVNHSEGSVDEALVIVLKDHAQKLRDRSKECHAEIASLENEKKKTITSEDLRTGFNAGHVNKAAPARSDGRQQKKQLTKTIETISPGKAQEPQLLADPNLSQPAAAAETSDDELPSLTPTIREFASIPSGNYQASFEAISKDTSLLDSETTDALLLEAFNNEMEGRSDAAKQCVHQGLLVQYCSKLGRDGVSLFFKRVSSPGSEGEKVFLDDVATTYKRIQERSIVLNRERSQTAGSGQQGVEQIQLQATDPNTTLSFDIPQEPPKSPSEIRIQLDDGTEASAEQQEEAYQYFVSRWEAWHSFPPRFQKALESGNLEEVNKVLGKMAVDEAEEIVDKLSQHRILNMEAGVRDMTAQGIQP